MFSPRVFSRGKMTLLATSTTILLLLVSLISLAESQQHDKSCSIQSNESQFTCPNCGGMQVDDCLNCDGYTYGDVTHHICMRRVLFDIHTDHHYHYMYCDLMGALVWFFTAAVAISAGVGGGGIYVPLGILLLQFAPKQASGLSQASVFGASLGGLLLNVRNLHPNEHVRSDPGVVDDKDKTESKRTLQVPLTTLQELEYARRYYTRPLIHYDMALFLAPMEMAGAVLGVLVQKLLPNYMYLLLAGLILGVTSQKTFVKYFSAQKAEQRLNDTEQRDGVMRMASSDGEYDPLPMVADGDATDGAASVADGSAVTSVAAVDVKVYEDGLPASNDMDDDDDTAHFESDVFRSSRPLSFETCANEELQRRIAFLEVDSIQYPISKIVSLAILWIGLLVLTLMKGGKGVESIIGITCQSPWYIVLIVVQFAWLLGFSCIFGRKLYKGQVARVAVRYPYLRDDPQWDWRNLQLFGMFTFVAGIVAGLIGVGGGMVLGPLMIEMGVNPRVSSATTATMIVLTASSVVFIVLTSGILHWSYAVFYFGVCFTGALLGKSKIDGYVKRTGKASIIIFILATIIALATVGCLVIMLLGLKKRNWCLDGFNAFCAESKQGGNDCPVDRLLQQFS
ncbi:hypothetical protein MPSEU_000177800 [Mayamaea pseudoterrestris]|nr:hypothetical protein MPSEU_000177800 [Mayamaea pseudoterrestris]